MLTHISTTTYPVSVCDRAPLLPSFGDGWYVQSNKSKCNIAYNQTSKQLTCMHIRTRTFILFANA